MRVIQAAENSLSRAQKTYKTPRKMCVSPAATAVLRIYMLHTYKLYILSHHTVLKDVSSEGRATTRPIRIKYKFKGYKEK
jgi:hypothetical protein